MKENDKIFKFGVVGVVEDFYKNWKRYFIWKGEKFGFEYY